MNGLQFHQTLSVDNLGVGFMTMRLTGKYRSLFNGAQYNTVVKLIHLKLIQLCY